MLGTKTTPSISALIRWPEPRTVKSVVPVISFNSFPNSSRCFHSCSVRALRSSSL